MHAFHETFMTNCMFKNHLNEKKKKNSFFSKMDVI